MVRDLDALDPTEARDFVMARLAAADAAAARARDVLMDVISAIAEGDHEYERAEALESVDADLGEASRAVQLAADLLDKVDPEESEPDVPEGDGHDDGE